jgi:C4-dicarboxylate-specific signal transduction histidine kinase
MAKDDPTREGLAFFGRVSAVISHDLKNVMATISETAGLLGDLVDLAGEGRALDPNELKSCSETIIDEIQRGYVTIGLLNAFAHSADQPLKEVDLAEMVTLAVNLSQCLSYARRVDLDLAGAAGVKILTNPFFLIDLLYNCLVWSYQSVGLDQGVRVAAGQRNETVEVVLPDLGAVEAASRETIDGAVEVLGAALNWDPSGQGLTITLPLNREGS